MENSESGYFNTDHSIGKRSYDNIFAMDPALFNTSTSISRDSNSHQDLDNILGGQFMDQLGSASGMMTPGFSAWNAQGTAYSPYPDISFADALPVDQQQSGTGLGIGSMTNGFVQSFPEPNGVAMQAITFSENQASVQMDGNQAAIGTQSDQNTAEPAAKRKLDTGADVMDGSLPKAKKKRGPRKTKQKSEEEKEPRRSGSLSATGWLLVSADRRRRSPLSR